MNRIVWTDVGPRDGLQSIATPVATDVKGRLVRELLGTGVPRVEATSLVSPKLVPQLADGEELLQALPREALPRIRVLVANRRGLERALDLGVRNVVFPLGVTESFNRRNVNRSIAQSFEDIADMVGVARRRGCALDVTLSVAFGCPFEGAVTHDAVGKLVRALDSLGVQEIAVADTIGVADPHQVSHLCRRLLTTVAAERLGLHVHDTRGLGVANVVAAYQVGVRRFEGSVGGIGGCPFAPRSTGNVASEDALGALHALGAVTACDLDAYCLVARRLGEDLGMELPGRLHRAGVWHPEEAAAAAVS